MESGRLGSLMTHGCWHSGARKVPGRGNCRSAVLVIKKLVNCLTNLLTNFTANVARRFARVLFRALVGRAVRG